MRIAMVSEHASPLATIGGVEAGGQSVTVSRLATALAGLGHEVTIYTRRNNLAMPSRVDLCPGVIVEHVPSEPAGQMSKDELLPSLAAFGTYLHRQWSQRAPDVVHSRFWTSGVAALHATAPLRLPHVHTYHGLGVVKRRYLGDKDTGPPARLAWEQTLGQQCDRLVAINAEQVFELVRLGVDRHRVSLVPCGVDVEHFTPYGPAAPHGQRPRLLAVGRLTERKGLDTAIEALAQIPGAELLIIGGPDHSALHADPECHRLRAVAKRIQVDNRVRFVGRVSPQRMPAWLRSAALVLCTPWYEPFGMVALEAMACGVPVVASAVGGLVDTVVERVTGAHVPPRRPDLLAAVVNRMLDDPIGRRACGGAAVERVRKRYSWQRIAVETAAVYRQVTATSLPATAAARLAIVSSRRPGNTQGTGQYARSHS
jgi:glycosyltransferase involved in cell wall biosynthesis